MTERDYVLGTQDEEIERLGLQHRIWRLHVLEGWRRAGLSSGMTVIDIGAGPGFVTRDLVETVGATGKVVALERSTRLLDVLRASLPGEAPVETLAIDVCEQPFGTAIADAAWCRWLLCFVSDPERTVRHIAQALRPGGTVIFHEYADYGSWRLMPPDPVHERFRALVMQSWRDNGGEPDIALQLPPMLSRHGLEIIATRPLVDIVGPADAAWEWPRGFIRSNASRLHELGYCSRDEADAFASVLNERPPETRLITPMVAEIIARKL